MSFSFTVRDKNDLISCLEGLIDEEVEKRTFELSNEVEELKSQIEELACTIEEMSND